jgi:hypothetical protein
MAQQLGDFKTEMAKEFGSVRAAIVQNKVWLLTSGIATLLALAALIGLKGH